MKNWICKQCGMYQKVNPNGIKAGQKVYFYKNKKIADRLADQVNVDVVKGRVLRRENGFITVVVNENVGIVKLKATDVYVEEAPNNFVYNMFGACAC